MYFLKKGPYFFYYYVARLSMDAPAADQCDDDGVSHLWNSGTSAWDYYLFALCCGFHLDGLPPDPVVRAPYPPGEPRPLYFLAHSTIPGAGMGLFAERLIKKNSIIGVYQGIEYPAVEESGHESLDYSATPCVKHPLFPGKPCDFHMRDPRYMMMRARHTYTVVSFDPATGAKVSNTIERPAIYIDAFADKRWDMRWINHVSETDEQLNCKFELDVKSGEVLATALCDIRPGKELFICYGYEPLESIAYMKFHHEEVACGDPDCAMTVCSTGFIYR